MGDPGPVIQAYDVVDLSQTDAGITGESDYGKAIGFGPDQDGFDIVFDMTGQPACMAGKYKTDPLSLTGIVGAVLIIGSAMVSELPSEEN